MAQPQPAYEKWQCCQCHTGPQVYATAKTCTGVRSDNRQCQHPVCNDCPKDNAIRPPGTTRQGLRARLHNMSFIVSPTFNTQRPLTRSRNHLSSRPGRPSVRGWWRCCSCDSDNNPALAKERCSSCGHQRDTRCTTYT